MTREQEISILEELKDCRRALSEIESSLKDKAGHDTSKLDLWEMSVLINIQKLFIKHKLKKHNGNN